MLFPTTIWLRYGKKFPAKVVAWNHTNGSGLTVQERINKPADLGGQVVAIPFWYSIHNVLLQQLLQKNGLTIVRKPIEASLVDREVNLVVLPPAEMVPALASRKIAGYCQATLKTEPLPTAKTEPPWRVLGARSSEWFRPGGGDASCWSWVP